MKYSFALRNLVMCVVFATVYMACGGGTGTFSLGDEEALEDPYSADSFYFRVSPVSVAEYKTYKIREGSTSDYDFNDVCEIPKESALKQEPVCVVDVKERDLYYYGLTLEFVVPPGMCDFVAFDNYFYYNFEGGRGPTAIKILQNVDAAGDPSDPAECTVDGFTSVGCAGPSTGDAGYDEVTIDATLGEESIVCKYNYSASDGSKPNCCIGTYTLEVEVYNTDDLETVSTKTEELNWGGSFGNGCLSGPAATDADWIKTDTGFPLSQAYSAYTDGRAIRYTLPAPADTHFRANNHEIANWHDNVLGGTGHQHTYGATTTNLPIIIEPGEDDSGSSIPSTNDAYRVRCMDQGGEVLHTITLYIREYNTEEDYDAFMDEPTDGTQNPDVIGDEGTDCEGLEGSCNDYTDLDDFKILPTSPNPTAPYSNTACVSPNDLTLGRSCFPSLTPATR